MVSQQEKDPTILLLLDRLRKDLGESAFEVVDHWSDDHFAVGLALPSNHRVLAYVSTSTNASSDNLYSYFLELPPTSKELVYAEAGGLEDCTYEQLLTALRSHWDLAG